MNLRFLFMPQRPTSCSFSYQLCRNTWLENRKVSGYWNVFAAYAALGDYIQDPANGYEFTLAEPESNWYGTHYGAQVTAIVQMGENPYNYQGKNWSRSCWKRTTAVRGPAVSILSWVWLPLVLAKSMASATTSIP